jgi:hypothetical protein
MIRNTERLFLVRKIALTRVNTELFRLFRMEGSTWHE